jgi:hypothetical protein
MIKKRNIEKNLTRLDKLFTNSKSGIDELFYSKLAILELCGWIEESIDGIILKSIHRKIKNPKNQKYLEDQIIERTFGFDYDFHVRKMLIALIGIVGVEVLEKKMDPVKHTLFKAALQSLKSVRDPEAHTYIIGTTKTLDAPSLIKSKLIPVYEGLDDIEKKMRASGF